MWVVCHRVHYTVIISGLEGGVLRFSKTEKIRTISEFRKVAGFKSKCKTNRKLNLNSDTIYDSIKKYQMPRNKSNIRYTPPLH